MFLRI